MIDVKQPKRAHILKICLDLLNYNINTYVSVLDHQIYWKTLHVVILLKF